jgi:quinol monooxygenase YgiN
MMILVDARCTILPEREREFIDAVRKIIPLVRKEVGCLRYELVTGVYGSGVFHFIEEWDSRKYLDDHIAQPHMQEYFAKTSPWNSSPVQLKIYNIQSYQSITMNDPKKPVS